MGTGGVIHEEMYAFFSREHLHTGILYNLIRNVIFGLLGLCWFTLQSLSLTNVRLCCSPEKC